MDAACSAVAGVATGAVAAADVVAAVAAAAAAAVVVVTVDPLQAGLIGQPPGIEHLPTLRDTFRQRICSGVDLSHNGRGVQRLSQIVV